jgi:hypothetical protein
MPISWNEIRHNAIRFSRDWTDAKSESAEKQTFWNEFFQVFGVSRRAVASFEEPVKKISGDYGYIDLFWPGIVLVEHKSLGKDLSKAECRPRSPRRTRNWIAPWTSATARKNSRATVSAWNSCSPATKNSPRPCCLPPKPNAPGVRGKANSYRESET